MSKKITIIDYGMGNLYSVQNALRSIGAEPVVTSDAAVIAQAEKILLPGVILLITVTHFYFPFVHHSLYYLPLNTLIKFFDNS